MNRKARQNRFRNTTQPLRLDYKDLRSRLITLGYTLRSFALAHGYSVQTTYSAAKGCRSGVESSKIANHLKRIAYASPQSALADRH